MCLTRTTTQSPCSKQLSFVSERYIVPVADTEGDQGGHAATPRSPRPNFAVAKVCRIQGWKTRI